MLAEALTADQIAQVVAGPFGLSADQVSQLVVSAEVLNHKPGERCTIRYRLAIQQNSDGQSSPPLSVIGKLYRRTDLAARMYKRMRDLRNALAKGGAPIGIPVPLAAVPRVGLLLQECVEGPDLRRAVASGDRRALSASARWLIRLHNSAPIGGLKTTSLQHELEKVSRWCLQIRPHLSQADLRHLCRAEDRLQRLAARLPRYAPAMVHNDFYYANALWDGKCIWVLDFDQLRLGDPALDVGHFAAHVENFAYRATGRADSFAEAVLVFVKSYAEEAAIDLDCSLPFHRASAFLKLAATEVIRQRRDWRQLTTALTSLACREAELLALQR